MLYEMQLAWSGIWTRVTVSISYDDNHYTIGISTQSDINLPGLFNAKKILVEGQQWYYLTHWRGDKGVHAFPKNISPKANVRGPLNFELTRR